VFKNMPCQKCLGVMTVTLKINCNPHTNQVLELPLVTTVLGNTRYDLVIGRKTIVKYGLTKIFDAYFGIESRTCLLDNTIAQRDLDPDLSVETPLDETQKATVVAALVHHSVSKEHFFGTAADDTDGTEHLPDISQFLPADLNAEQSALSDENLPPMQGTDGVHLGIRALCRKYHTIFSRFVSKTPAKIKPMKLDIELDNWRQDINRQSPRPQTPERQAEIDRQTKCMLELGIIRPATNVGYYSQVLLAPKPGGKWRFCVDYRRLNAITNILSSYPIPRIDLMIQRLGQKRFKLAGKVDFTSGYHQTVLDEKARQYAAFVTQKGIFEPTRVPFGLKGAPSYFQGHIERTVLPDLIHRICELYIDDVITWGSTDEEFLENLETLFARFQKMNIKLHPDKCLLGVPELEFVGHLINEHGVTMSQDKIRKVLNFPLPKTSKDLRSFIGLVNYFHPHVRDSSELLRPLHQLLSKTLGGMTGHKAKRQLVVWTEDSKQSYEAIKAAVENCTTLFFLNDTDPIFLKTDASDYGIGGYLYQIIPTPQPDGTIKPIEYPVAFMSHSLNEVQSRWNVPEKECFAIFKAFQTFEYLIRDRRFTLLTDHRNLTYMGSETSSPKVTRWKIAIQDYDFDIQHVPGKDNEVADGFSRLTEHKVFNRKSKIGETSFINAKRDYTIVIPKEKLEILNHFHNELVGHHGHARTLSMLKASGQTWKHMNDHVRVFLKQCAICQKLAFERPVVIARPFVTSTEYEPMQRICIDTVGELPATNPHGFKHILVIIDGFTRWVELYPMVSTGMEEAAEHLLNFFGRFGCPRELLSDRGSQFVNKIISSFLKLVGTKHILSLSYSKEENGRVERANREVLRHLRAIVTHTKIANNWHVKLPMVQRIMNASIHSITQQSPARLIFGDAITLDRNIFLTPEQLTITANSNIATTSEVDSTAVEIDPAKIATWTAERRAMQREILDITKDIQQKIDIEHVESINPATLTRFENESFVLVMYPRSTIADSRPPTKLHSFWRGPLKIISSIGNEYQLLDMVNNTIEKHHVTSLKQFFFSATTSPREIALTDEQQWDIERIVGHHGDLQKKSTLEFLVKWTGLTEDFNRYLPWKELFYSTQLTDYLHEIGQQKLLPKNRRR
jgi:transposase InsO family protein